MTKPVTPTKLAAPPPPGAIGAERRKLVRDILWSLGARLLPMLVAVAVIPDLLRGMGEERFGLLMLAWALIGYFSLFDLGLGRAMTQLIARQQGQLGPDPMGRLIWTGIGLMSVLGFVGGVCLALLAEVLSSTVLGVPAALREEARWSFLLLGPVMPLVVAGLGLRAVLEAHGRFRSVSVILFGFGCSSFGIPWLLLHGWSSAPVLIGGLALAQVLACVGYAVACFQGVPAMRRTLRGDRCWVMPLLRFGGWMTVSNVIGPLMVYLDRFVIGAMLTLAAVSYYATPYEVVTKLWFIPAAVCTVLFPRFAAAGRDQPDQLRRLMRGGVLLVAALMIVPVLGMWFGAHAGLTLWLGETFATEGSAVVRWLVVGVLFNSLAQVPFAMIQGVGRPDVTAKIHVVELIPYLVLMLLLISLWGIEGAAIAWASRAFTDFVLLSWWACRMVGRPSVQRSQSC